MYNILLQEKDNEYVKVYSIHFIKNNCYLLSFFTYLRLVLLCMNRIYLLAFLCNIFTFK